MSNRTAAGTIGLLVLASALLVTHGLARSARDRELDIERRRAEAEGGLFVARFAQRIGAFQAEARALARAMPTLAEPPRAEVTNGYRVWFLDHAGRPLPSFGAVLPLIPATALRRLRDSGPLDSSPVLGPLRGPDGGEVLVALARVGANSPAHAGEWLALSADVRALAAEIGLEELLAAGYEYDILVGDSVPAQRRGIRGANVTLSAPVRIPVSLGTAALELALSPRGGWATTRAPNVPLTFGFLLSIVLGVGAYELGRLPDRLRREGATRLDSLESANRRLLDAIQTYQERERHAEAELSRDVVTGLPNRAYFVGRIERALSRVRARPGSGFAVLAVGLDGLRNLSDTLGPEAGDRMLTAMALRLDRAMRPGDTAARIGDDAFAVLLYDVSTPESATAAARRIREALSTAVLVNGRDITAAAWIGIEVSRSGYERPDEMLQHAQAAMERAKSAGVGGTALFDPALREEAAQRFQLESDLRAALDRGELRVVYQVVVSLATGAAKGAEALVRWAHPLEGVIPPVRFIGLAEETGLIVPITRWILRQACLQLVEWRTALPDFYVSVNLSARDLQDPTLCDYLRGLIGELDIPPGALRVEITEGMLMADVRVAGEIIDGLRELRIPILLDDFGTGYSSLSYLHRFRLDVLKIDRAFVRDIVTNQRTQNITGTIVHLAADLDMRTIAEGIDDPAQIEVLHRLGCDFGQGYHFGKPADAASVFHALA
jgi:diguanylate cyclase (GGDEF)-like protein